ncbi:MAG: hypothetical protein ACKV0T_09925 [Planctomycetales bacterium]
MPPFPSLSLSRRKLLQSGSAAALSTLLPQRFLPTGWGAETPEKKLPVAAVVSVYHTNSHADVIVGKILEGFRQDGGAGPALQLVSLFADQHPASDLSRKLGETHAFRLARSINEALTLGTDKLQVAGVLSIGEHGDYPFTPETKQHMYPRRRFFDEIVATFRRCGASVPVFNDKHLSYRWDDAKSMYDTARTMRFPFLAGSSVPVAWRYPAVELSRECEIEAALSIGYGGFEAYGFHALEGHQAMIERRRGGETGVASVQAVTKAAIRRTQEEGAWSKELFAAALATLPGQLQDTGTWSETGDSAVYLVQHRDGLRSAVVMANGLAGQFAFATKLKGVKEPVTTWFKLQEVAPFGHFAYLVRAIEQTFRTGREAYPVERTLLTSGILDRVMQSLAQEGKLLETPELAISYRAADWPFANRDDSPLTLPND